MKKFKGFPRNPKFTIVVNGIEYKGNPEEIIKDLHKKVRQLEENRQSYYCVVPWHILNDKRINATTKLIYAEITALSNKEGYCWASNGHFAKIFGITDNRVSKLISDLKNKEYVYIEIDKKAGNKRYIWIRPPIGENNHRYGSKQPEPMVQNNHKDNTNIDNTKEINKRKKKYSSIKDIKEQDLIEISERYKVPLSFVELQLEKMENWLGAKGKRYKNYRLALMNWVLRAAESKVEGRAQDDSKRGVDARGI